MENIIKQKWKKIKSFSSNLFRKIKQILAQEDFFFYVFIIFIASTSYILGLITNCYENKTEIKNIILEKHQKINTEFYASKKGRYYYLPWCYSGSEKNKIIFKSEIEAQKAGYQKSKSCDGL